MGVGVSCVGLWGRDIIVSAPDNPLLRSGASRAGSVMPCCWGCRAPHYPMGSASVLGFHVESRLLLHVSLPAFLSHLVPLLAAHARLPLFLALMVPHRVETSACMFWGTLGAPGRVYSQANRALSRGSRGADSVPKTTFSLVTSPDLFHCRHTHRHP